MTQQELNKEKQHYKDTLELFRRECKEKGEISLFNSLTELIEGPQSSLYIRGEL